MKTNHFHHVLFETQYGLENLKMKKKRQTFLTFGSGFSKPGLSKIPAKSLVLDLLGVCTHLPGPYKVYLVCHVALQPTLKIVWPTIPTYLFLTPYCFE